MIEINGKNIVLEGKHVDRSHDVVIQTEKYTLYQVYTPEFFFALRSRVVRGMDLPEIPEVSQFMDDPNMTIFVVVIRGPIPVGEQSRFLWAAYGRDRILRKNRNAMNEIVSNKIEKGSKWDSLTGETNFFGTRLQWKTPPKFERAELADAKLRAREEREAARVKAAEEAQKIRRESGKERIRTLLSSGGSIGRIRQSLRTFRFEDTPEMFFPEIVENNRLDALELISDESIKRMMSSPVAVEGREAPYISIFNLISSLEMFKTLEARGMEWKTQQSALYTFINQPSEISNYIFENMGDRINTFVKEYLTKSGPADEDEALSRAEKLVAAGWKIPVSPQDFGNLLKNLLPWTTSFMAKAMIYIVMTALDSGADPKMLFPLGAQEFPLWILAVERPNLDFKRSTISDINNKCLAFVRQLLDRGADPNVNLPGGSRLLGQIIGGCRVCPASMMKFAYDLKTKYGFRFGDPHEGKPLSKAFEGKSGTQFDRVLAFVLRQERLESGTYLTLDNELEEKRKREQKIRTDTFQS